MLSRDPQMINSFDECVAEIELALSELKQVSQQSDFSSQDQYNWFADQVEHLKRFYERAEFLLLKEEAR